MKGNLYLIPNTLGEVVLTEVLPITVKKKIEEIDIYIV
jgi:16S rRNA (cytidine1402-2'-O)-methyltransferase